MSAAIYWIRSKQIAKRVASRRATLMAQGRTV